MSSHKRKRSEMEKEEQWRWCPIERYQQQGRNTNRLKTSVYFRVHNLNIMEKEKGSFVNIFDWYTINLLNTISSSSPASYTHLKAGSRMPTAVPLSSSSVAMGSKIYVLGGCPIYNSSEGEGASDEFFDTMFYYDTTDGSTEGWKQGPSMFFKRCNPFSVPVDGKLYVIGGIKPTYGEKNPSVVEVFDPRLNQWKLLPPSFPSPSFHHWHMAPLHALLLDSCGRKHLLLNVMHGGALYTYNLDSNAWKLYDPSFGSYNLKPVAILDGLIYSYKASPNIYEAGKLFAYDIIRRKWFRKHVKGLGKDKILHPHHHMPGHLFHLGNGKLCLISPAGSPSKTAKVNICCTIFTVEPQLNVVGKKRILHAHVESTTFYRARGWCVTDCHALQ